MIICNNIFANWTRISDLWHNVINSVSFWETPAFFGEHFLRWSIHVDRFQDVDARCWTAGTLSYMEKLRICQTVDDVTSHLLWCKSFLFTFFTPNSQIKSTQLVLQNCKKRHWYELYKSLKVLLSMLPPTDYQSSFFATQSKTANNTKYSTIKF